VREIRRVLKAEHEGRSATSEPTAGSRRRRTESMPAPRGGSNADLEHR
jgi:hypothetical protein